MTTLSPKDPNTPTEYAIDPRRLAYPMMMRDWPYEEGAVVRAPQHTGWYYECTTPGETGHHYPRLPRADGETVQDGSVTWTAKHPQNALVPIVISVEWIITPAGELTVQSHRIENGILYPTLVGGVDGREYEVTARVTWSTPQQEDITVTIPVAQL